MARTTGGIMTRRARAAEITRQGLAQAAEEIQAERQELVIPDFEDIQALKDDKELELMELAVPGFSDLPVAELMAIPFSVATTPGIPTRQDNQQLSGRQAFLWTHVSIIATNSDFTWVLQDSFYQGFFTFDSSQIFAETFSGLGDNQNNKQPTKLPCAVYLPSNTSLTFFATDLSGANPNEIEVTLLGMKVRRGSGFHKALIRRMQYIGMGLPADVGE